MLREIIEGPKVSEQGGDSMLSDANAQLNAAAMSELEWTHKNVSTRSFLGHFDVSVMKF